MSDKLPDNGGYVAAAYLVFLILLLIYVAVMATKASRIERDLAELQELTEEAVDGDPGADVELPEPVPTESSRS